jgi:hypothetical protein
MARVRLTYEIRETVFVSGRSCARKSSTDGFGGFA